MLFKKEAGFRNLAILLILICSLARAQDGVELSGLAVYTDTARDIYVAGLQTIDGKPPADITNLAGPMTMEYRIATRRLSSRGFSGTLLLQAELGAGHRAPEGVIDVLGDLKQRVKGSLSSGDQFEIVLTGSGDTAFVLNGVELLRDSSAEVFSYLIQGWIGGSASALMRDKLLSANLDKNTMLRYESLIPLNERVELVASWVEDTEEEAVPATAEVKEQQVAAASAAVAEKAAPTPAPKATVAAAPEPKVETQAVEEAATVAALSVAAPAVAQSASSAVPKKSTAPAPKKTATAEQKEPAVQKEQVAAATTPGPEQQATGTLADIDDREYQLQLNTYVRAVMTQVFKNVRYPRRAVKRELEGQVELLAQLSKEGELLGVSMESSSGHEILDNAAIKAVESATPFPELNFVAQEEFVADNGDAYVMLIPVKFMLN